MRWLGLGLLTAVACEPMQPSGTPFAPVEARGVPQAAPPEALPTEGEPEANTPPPAKPNGEPGYDFTEDLQEPERPQPPVTDPVVLQAMAQGMSRQEAEQLAAEQATKPEPKPAAKSEPVAMAAAAPTWDPSVPIPGTSFGVRVLSTLLDLSPPHAVLVLSNGEKRVVMPGDFVEEEKILVMAIGKGAVQLAQITPNGFYATVDTKTVATLSAVGQ